jgi:hypothetical protein
MLKALRARAVLRPYGPNWREAANAAAAERQYEIAADAYRREAPKAAMLWCPNAIPFDAIAAYYPGDDAVDWVGVNFYSVPFYDNNRFRPAHDDPTDLLRPIYLAYSSRKPIAIGEWAATHFAACEGVTRTAFAAEKIARFYAALPRLFPRVKMVNWYDSNNLKHAGEARRLNNYPLTDDPAVLLAYREAVRIRCILAAPASQPRLWRLASRTERWCRAKSA